MERMKIMSKNLAVYPMKKMKITQSYNGSVSHLPYSSGNKKDYPIDEAGADSGRDYMLCPCDKMKVVRIYGVGNGGTNTIWLTSINKVSFPDGTSDYLSVMVIHPNDDDLKKLKVGKIFEKGEKMFREGTDGHATGNHLHFSVGKGKLKGTGWEKNDKGKWVLTTTGGACKPEAAFYIDKASTVVLKTGGIVFPELLSKQKTYITTAVLNIRQNHSTAAKKLGAYNKGVKIKVFAVCGSWGQTDKGWVCLDYCKAV